MLDYIQILRFHYGKKLSGREIAETQECGKTAINDFLKKFRESAEFSYPLASTVTNELINQTLYKSRGGSIYFRTRYIFHKSPHFLGECGGKLFEGKGIKRVGLGFDNLMYLVPIPQKNTFSMEV